MTRPRELEPSTSALAFFGAELRRYRTVAGLSQGQLAGQVYVSTALVGMVETARRVPGRELAQDCDEALGTGGALARLWPLVSKETFPTWFQPFVELEREAVSLRWFEPLLIPGLLQTEDYARAMVRAGRPADTDEQIDELVTARMERQSILDADEPPLLWAVLDESALHRPIGGAKVMADQLGHLVEMARRPRITVQVIPWSVGAHASLTGPFVVIEMADNTRLAYLDSVASGRVVDRADDVATCALLYDTLQVEALPTQESLDLLQDMRGEFTDD